MANEWISAIITCVIAIILGGIVTPIIMSLICDKMGWFK